MPGADNSADIPRAWLANATASGGMHEDKRPFDWARKTIVLKYLTARNRDISVIATFYNFENFSCVQFSWVKGTHKNF